MLKYFKFPFGASGDKSSVPDIQPPDGSVSYQSGFGEDYELDLDTNTSALPISRSQFNQILYQATSGIKELQEFGGASQFITSAENGGTAFPYAKFARVIYGGNVYESQIANNTDTPSSSNWLLIDVAGLVKRSEFTGANQSLSVPGHQNIPGGLIFKMETYHIGDTLSPTTFFSKSFAEAFPNACLNAQITIIDSSGNANCFVGLNSKTKSGVTGYITEISGAAQNIDLDIFAIGY